MTEPAGSLWTTCATCGDATPPGAEKCPTCGKEAPSAAEKASPGATATRRFRIHRGLRIVVIVAVAVALTGVFGWAVLTGPPIAADPLTANWNFTIGAGNFTYISGQVTGGDYITGNFTVITPPGALVLFEVFNSTSFSNYAHGVPRASPQAAPADESSGLIDFAAEYSDTYYFVWADQYPAMSHIALTLYAQTEYESSVVVE
ncbi:MAG: hypothetical protein ACREC5_03190 [Thermoplasmata archaeon]